MQNNIELYNLSLFIFRRDLRIEDNTALLEAAKFSKKILACFIFDSAQSHNNPYFSKHAFQFMCESLEILQQQIPLHIFYGNPKNIVEECIKKHKIQAVFFNKDYTPFSKNRDECIQKTCL